MKLIQTTIFHFSLRGLLQVLITGSMVVVFLGGCAVQDSSDLNAQCGAEPPEITAQRMAAFDQSLHALLLQNTCVSCHDGKSGKAPYPHSSLDLTAAYQAARQLVDFDSVSQSRLVKKILTDHNCGSDSQCQSLASSALNQIETWSRQESFLPPPPLCRGSIRTGLRVALPGKTLQASNLTKTQDTTLRWDLSEIDPSIGKSVFEIQVRAFSDLSATSQGSYLVSRPTLATADRRLLISDIRISINGRVDTQYANYAPVQFVVDKLPFDATASILGFPPVSPFSMIVDWINNPAADTLGFTFVLKESSEAPSNSTKPPGCHATDKFQLVFDNVMNLEVGNPPVKQCTQCHGGNNMAAAGAFNLSGNGVDPCLQALMRVNFASPLQSLLILKPAQKDGTNNHPAYFDLASQPLEMKFILDWINAEAAAANNP